MVELTTSVKNIIALLNNINELLVISNDRTKCREVMHALESYAESKKIKIPKDAVKSFYSILIDSRPYTITTLLQQIAQEIIKNNCKK